MHTDVVRSPLRISGQFSTENIVFSEEKVETKEDEPIQLGS